MAKVTGLETTLDDKEEELMVAWFTIGPGQYAVPVQLMGVLKEYIVTGNEVGATQEMALVPALYTPPAFALPET
jgi:hypothetical protein